MKQTNKKNQVIPINQEEIYHYLKDIRKIKVMTPEREKELSELIKSGTLTSSQIEQVHKELLEGNLRFVITIAKQYQNQGLDFPDLVAEGNLGLLKAIKNFDWNKDLRFISYAVWWVKQSILQSLNDNARTIRLPVNVVQEYQKAKKDFDKKGKDIDSKFEILPSMVNLDNVINDEGDTLVDMLKNENASLPDEKFNNRDALRDRLRNILNTLDERERVIIDDYFGLTGDCRTLEDIGQDFDLTKERVRQIKEKTLRKLRNECKELFNYF